MECAEEKLAYVHSGKVYFRSSLYVLTLFRNEQFNIEKCLAEPI